MCYHLRLVRSRTLLAAMAVLFIAISAARGSSPGANPVTIDTQSVIGVSGYLLFSFNPSTDPGTPLNSSVSVSSSSFSTFALQNSGSSNYDLMPFTFGASLTFTPTFTPTATPGADQGSLFSLVALNSSLDTIPTSDPTGANAAVMIVQNANGSLDAPVIYAPFLPVPEASTAEAFGMFILAGIFMFVKRRRMTSTGEQ